jgi:hypothetical protein
VLACAACEAVPDLNFAADASIDASFVHDSATADHALIPDGASDAGAEGGSAANGGCPDAAPPLAMCCGDLPCYGDHCTTGQNCADCPTKCAVSAGGTGVCCAQGGGGVRCVDAGSLCL